MSFEKRKGHMVINLVSRECVEWQKSAYSQRRVIIAAYKFDGMFRLTLKML